MSEITFSIEPCHETGGIITQGDSLAALEAVVADVVRGYFDSPERLSLVLCQRKELP